MIHLMSETPITVLVGDAYLCDCALAEREAALQVSDPDCERHLLFADECDFESMAVDLRSASLFALARHFVIRRAEKAKKPKQLAAWIETPLSEGTYVTILSTGMKATSPIIKAAKKAKVLTSLPSPKPRATAPLAKQILESEGLRATPDAIRELVARTDADLQSIRQEARKLSTALGEDEDSRPVDLSTVQQLVFSQAEETVYPFFDRLGERNVQGALAALTSLRDDPTRILGGIIRHLTQLSMIRLLLDRRTPAQTLAKQLGRPDWLVRRLIGQAKRFTFQQLTAALQRSIELDTQLKSGGIHPADAVLKATYAATLPPPPSRG